MTLELYISNFASIDNNNFPAQLVFLAIVFNSNSLPGLCFKVTF